MATGTTRCDGIGCENQEPASGRDRTAGGDTHRGWIELRVDGESHRFCSWDCLTTFVNDRIQGIAGD
ncbi:MAG TPA: hypothetical protein VGM69_13900 [Chloroflexota bacterium]|jgi:hypothetical protein